MLPLGFRNLSGDLAGGTGPAGTRQPQRHGPPDRDAIPQPESFEAAAKGRRRPIIGVRHRRSELKARLQDAPHMRQGDAPLLAKPDRVRNPGLRPPGRIGTPLRWQVQLETEGPRQLVAEQHRRDRDLAIGDLAEGAAVLTFHPDGVFALLGETRVVDREHALPDRHQGPQSGPQRGRLPGGHPL